MSYISVQKCRDTENLPQRLAQDLSEIINQVREHAFGRFERRGGMPGLDLDDWLEAEREVVWSPPSELIEKKDAYRARIAVPGFEANEVQVAATPEALIVEAESAHTHNINEGDVRMCEFSGKKLYRRIDLPSKINVEQATASLNNGILEVSAPKVEAAKQARTAA